MPPLPNEQETPPYAPPATDPVIVTQPHIVSPDFRGTTVDTRYVSEADLLTHIAGSEWVVEYFSQVIGEDEELSHQQINQHAVYQQYLRIKKLELKVTSPLSQVQDPEDNEWRVVGTANTYPFVIPNVGDMFLADIGDGREGVFTITSSEKKTIFKEACYEVTYVLTDYSDGVQARLNDLIEKTVKTVHYERRFLQMGQYPMLVDEQVVTLDKLQKRLREMVSVFMSEFFSTEHQTLLIPEQDSPAYDPFVVKTILAVLNVEEHTIIKRIRELNVDGADGLKNFTIWSMLLEMDNDTLSLLTEKMWLVSNKSFNRWPVFAGVYHSKITGVVYPFNHVPGCFTPSPNAGRPIWERDPISLDEIYRRLVLNGFGNVVPDEDGLPDDSNLQPPPLIHRVRKDEYYVFSKAFYERRSNGQSRLELLTHATIEHTVYDPALLLEICDAYKTWTPLDRFYYIPILIVLLKTCIRRL